MSAWRYSAKTVELKAPSPRFSSKIPNQYSLSILIYIYSIKDITGLALSSVSCLDKCFLVLLLWVMNLERVYFRVRGKVQGVGFRWFVRDTARELLLTGWTRNVLDGSVEGEIQGSRDKITLFLKDIKIKHSWADVSSLETEARQTLSEKEFTIRLTV